MADADRKMGEKKHELVTLFPSFFRSRENYVYFLNKRGMAERSRRRRRRKVKKMGKGTGEK